MNFTHIALKKAISMSMITCKIEKFSFAYIIGKKLWYLLSSIKHEKTPFSFQKFLNVWQFSWYTLPLRDDCDGVRRSCGGCAGGEGYRCRRQGRARRPTAVRAGGRRTPGAEPLGHPGASGCRRVGRNRRRPGTGNPVITASLYVSFKGLWAKLGLYVQVFVCI